MEKKSVEDLLQQGIYGKKELKPEEKKKYLGTYRERVAAVLSQGQVMEKTIYQAVIKRAESYPGASILLNGNIDYSYLKKYVDAAALHHIPYKLVLNHDADTQVGLVVAAVQALDCESIEIARPVPKVTAAAGPRPGRKLLGRIKRFLKRG